jgi:hypothetical protein
MVIVLLVSSYVLGIPAGVVASSGIGNRPVVPGQGKHVKVIVAQDYIPDSFHFIVGVPLTGCTFVH